QRRLVGAGIARDTFFSRRGDRAQRRGRGPPEIGVVAQIEGDVTARHGVERNVAVAFARQRSNRVDPLIDVRRHSPLHASAAASCAGRPSAAARIAVSLASRFAASGATFWYEVQRTKSSGPSPE